MKYIQESAIIPDEVIEEAVPYSRIGNWARKAYYGDDLQTLPGDRGPGVIGKIGKLFRDPAKYEADKEQFQGERAANWLYAQLGPVIEQGRKQDGVDVTELLSRLNNLDAKPGVKYSVLAGKLPTLINLQKRAGELIPPDQVIELLKNLGIETVKAFAMGTEEGGVGQQPTKDNIVRLLQTSNLDTYQRSLILAAAFKSVKRI